MTSNWWNFKLTVFELTVHFKHEMIGIWQRFQRNFELSGTDEIFSRDVLGVCIIGICFLLRLNFWESLTYSSWEGWVKTNTVLNTWNPVYYNNSHYARNKVTTTTWMVVEPRVKLQGPILMLSRLISSVFPFRLVWVFKWS